MTGLEIEKIIATIKAVPELSGDRLIIYARLWQFETWLRQMVYVELRAKYGDDWNKHLKGNVDHARDSDQLLTHMPTPEKMELSFVSFGALVKTIYEEWALFEEFLPPQNIWNARIEEVSQIRNRIAHFRKGHIDDYQRVVQLMRDVDKGFFEFCTSLNKFLYSLSRDTSDPVIHEFAPLNPYIKRDIPDTKDNIYTHFAGKFEIKIDIVKRPWIGIPENFTQVIGQPGFFYALNIHEHDGREFHYEDLLKSTKSIHQHILYISMGSNGDHLRVLIPSLLGKEMMIEIIRAFIDAAANNSWPGRSDRSFSSDSVENIMNKIESIADKWPEYVIGPENPISFLAPDMECSFFGA